MPEKINLNEKKIVEMYESGLSLKQIGKIFEVSKPTILKRLRKKGIERRKRKYVFNEFSFHNLNSRTCYWAGFIAADGWLQNNKVGVELNIIDENHLIKLCDFIGTNRTLSYRQRKRSGKMIKYCSVLICSKQIVKDLKDKFNIVERKSQILLPPKIPKKFARSYIRGYFDGDGCFDIDGNNLRITITSGSEKLLDWIKSILKENLVIGNPKVAKRKDSETFYLKFNGNKQVPKIMNWLYENCKDNFLNRKKYYFMEALK